MKILKPVFLAAIWLAVAFSYAQAQDINPTDKIPVDEKVRIGTLENGLKYYIRQNPKPENRVELRLAVNAGSLCETDIELGLAHFTEHMCFNGTKNFEKNELVNVLERMGMKFGGDVNAYTSFAETVYMLHIPTDKEELVNQGFQIIEDWAHNVSFTDEEIDKERGVIIEEWRMGLGADDRMRKKSFPVIFKGSMYASRIPIGTKEILESFKYETIKDFYNKWYRPNLQAVIVVGDINVDEMEAKIKKHFSAIENPAGAPAREVYSIPDNDEPLISIETDVEATNNMVMFGYKHPKTDAVTLGDYKQDLIESLYNGMMNSRLEELSQKPDCPYIMGYTSYGPFLARNLDAYMSYGIAKENKILETLETILLESQRVKQHGFTQTELERQKLELLKRYEKSVKESDKTDSERYAEEYVSHFLTKTPIPSAEDELKLAKKFVPEITLDDINGLAAKWITENNLIMMIQAPEKEGVIVPTKEEVIGVLKKAKDTKVDAYIDDVSDAPLLSAELAGSKVKTTTVNETLGFTEITLENGIQVVLKPTDFKNNEIVMSSYSMGGVSHCSDDEVLGATFSSEIIRQCGAGEFSNVQLEKKLKGKDLRVSPTISETDEGFRGKCAPDDLETMLQLVYLYATAPRADAEAFESFISKTSSQMKFFGSSPQAVFSDTLQKIVSSNNPRAISLPKPEQLAKIELDKVMAFYKSRFEDLDDMKFFFVGNFKVDEITPVLEKYLGSLPATSREESFLDKSSKFPEGIVDASIYKGVDEKSMVAIIMKGDFEYTYLNKLHIKVMTEALNIKLREYLREEEGGVYGVQIMQQVQQFPKSQYNLIVVFPCAPKNVKKLSKIVFKEMDKMINEGPTDEDLEKVKENLLRSHEENIKDNNFWLSTLESGYFNKTGFDNFTKYLDDVKAVTKEDIRKAATKYITPDHYVKVALFPEKK